MCGIVGLIDRSMSGDRAGLERRASAMAEAIAHRGPDADGVWAEAEAGVVLAHRRLSIVDLSPAGAQPMVSADGRWALTYNGEIYNHDEIRKLPELSGVAWRGRSDTEVLVESIAARGLDRTLADLNGMFAFAVYDRRERTLHLVRDRLGIKPLFFAASGERVLFASELRALVAGGLAREIDPRAVASFLRYNYVPAPNAIFAGAGKLAPAEIVTIDAKLRVERRRYWRLEDVAARGLSEPIVGSDEDLESALEELLVDAIGRQMMADVPLGAFLSGGIDSSLVTALMVRASRGPVRTYSIGFDEDAYDESRHAQAIAAHLGTVHTPLVLTARDALDAAPSIVDHFDEPFSDHSQIPTFLLSRLTRAHVTVALSGDGGDELFAGYNRYLLAGRTWARVAAVPQPARALAARLMTLPPPQAYDTLARLLPGQRHLQAGQKVKKLASVLPLGPDQVFDRLVSVNPDADAIAGCVGYPAFGVPAPIGLGHVARMRFADTLAYMPDDVLQKVDRATMAVSLEARPPLLDHRVVEFSWRLPERALIRNGETKWILRRVLERHVPRTLFDRPKMGFGVPLADWLRGGLRDWAGDLIGSTAYGGGFVDRERARLTWAEHQSGKADHAYRLWPLIVFEAWRRRWHA